MKSANFSNEILEIRDEPRSVFFDFGPDLIASESDEGVGGRTGLQVGGTVADHYQLLETMRVLQASNHASFSTRLRGQLVCIKSSVIPIIRKEQPVGEDVVPRNM